MRACLGEYVKTKEKGIASGCEERGGREQSCKRKITTGKPKKNHFSSSVLGAEIRSSKRQWRKKGGGRNRIRTVKRFKERNRERRPRGMSPETAGEGWKKKKTQF